MPTTQDITALAADAIPVTSEIRPDVSRPVIAAWAEMHQQGLWVFPLRDGSKQPGELGIRWGETWIKKNRDPWPQLASAHFDATGLWLATGQVSKRVVLDMDSAEAVEYWRGQLGADVFDRALRVSRGHPDRMHLHFRIRSDDDRVWPSWNHESKGASLPPGVRFDVRGDGGGAVVPPSVHESGSRYAWSGGELLDAPEVLWRPKSNHAGRRPAGELQVHDGVSPIDPDAVRQLEKHLDRIRQLQNGECDTGFVREAYWPARAVRGGVFPEQYVWDKIEGAVSESDMEMDHAQNKWEYLLSRAEKEPLHWTSDSPVALHSQTPATSPTSSADADQDTSKLRDGPGKKAHVIWDFERTELGNAQRLQDRHGDNLRHTREWGWLVWDGRRWEVNPERARRLMQSVVYEIAAERAAMQDSGSIEMWYERTASSNGIRAALTEASVFEEIAAVASDFDVDPFKLLVGNGVVNLRNGHLSPPHRRDMLTKGTDVGYDPEMPCPKWKRFLDETFAGDIKMIEYVQRMFGMCLIGNNSHQVAFFLYGPGGTGKTTLVNVLTRLLSDYASAADLNVFSDPSSGHNDRLASLAGARMVAFSETRAGQRINEAWFKKMTGEDLLTASFKGKSEFQFRPAFTPIMFGNHRPALAFDSGVARRIKVIPVTGVVPKDKRNEKLVEELVEQEGPAILHWAVQGAMNTWDSKVEDPPAVIEQVEEFREDSDHLSRFIADCLVVGPQSSIPSRELWARYELWTHGGGVDFVGAQRQSGLTSRLVTWGMENGKKIRAVKTNNVRKISGVGSAPPTHTD